MSQNSSREVLSIEEQGTRGLHLVEKFLWEQFGMRLDKCAATLLDNPEKVEAVARAFAEGVTVLNSVPNIRLVQTEKQAKGGTVTLGEMLEVAKGHRVQPEAFDFYCRHKDKIPADWTGKVIFFPEREISSDGPSSAPFVVCGGGGSWLGITRWLSDEVGPHYFVAVSADSV